MTVRKLTFLDFVSFTMWKGPHNIKCPINSFWLQVRIPVNYVFSFSCFWGQLARANTSLTRDTSNKYITPDHGNSPTM